MRDFNYSEIKNQKWDSEILGLIAAIYKEVGKQELYLKQRPEQLEKLVEDTKHGGFQRDRRYRYNKYTYSTAGRGKNNAQKS